MYRVWRQCRINARSKAWMPASSAMGRSLQPSTLMIPQIPPTKLMIGDFPKRLFPTEMFNARQASVLVDPSSKCRPNVLHRFMRHKPVQSLQKQQVVKTYSIFTKPGSKTLNRLVLGRPVTRLCARHIHGLASTSGSRVGAIAQAVISSVLAVVLFAGFIVFKILSFVVTCAAVSIIVLRDRLSGGTAWRSGRMGRLLSKLAAPLFNRILKNELTRPQRAFDIATKRVCSSSKVSDHIGAIVGVEQPFIEDVSELDDRAVVRLRFTVRGVKRNGLVNAVVSANDAGISDFDEHIDALTLQISTNKQKINVLDDLSGEEESFIDVDAEEVKSASRTHS